MIIVIDKAYMFDSSIHEWQECTERANVENDITMLPVRIMNSLYGVQGIINLKLLKK